MLSQRDLDESREFPAWLAVVLVGGLITFGMWYAFAGESLILSHLMGL